MHIYLHRTNLAQPEMTGPPATRPVLVMRARAGKAAQEMLLRRTPRTTTKNAAFGYVERIGAANAETKEVGSRFSLELLTNAYN